MQMELSLDPACSSQPSIFSCGQRSTVAVDLLSGKTSLEPIAATRGETLQAWLSSWQDSTTLQCPTTAGARKAARWATMACSNGHVWTRNGSEWRSGAAACSLSSILETGPVASQYFLSAKACAGILRRAAKRGKTLPEQLHRALAAVAGNLIAEALPDYFSPLYCLAHGQGAELGIDRSPTLTRNHEAPIVAGDLTPIAFDARQDCVSSTEVFGALGSSSPQAQAIAFSCKDHGADAAVELAPTMRAMNSVNSNQNAGGQLAVAFVQNSRDEVRLMNGDGQIAGALSAESGMKQTCYVAVCVTGEVTHTLKAEGFDASEDGTGRGQPIIATRDVAQYLTSNYGKQLDNSDTNLGPNVALQGMAVRRLTPIECERLQGFPDGYTAIPIKKYARKTVTKLRPDQMWRRIDGAWWLMSADGPRYKALGNSMAVPVMAWIGRQIQLAMETI